MDNSGTQSVMDDRCGDNDMNVEYNLVKKASVPEKITKLPGLTIRFTVKRGVVGFMDGGIDGQGYEIGERVSRYIEDSRLPPSNMTFQ